MQERLEDLEQYLERLDVARQYFKTIYIKQELADVTGLVMSTGLVATVCLVGTGSRTGPFTVLEHWLFVPLAVAANSAPLAPLISHVFRIATAASRPAAITPFLASGE